jgi:probable phosphoglycerate mutase
MELLLIRHALPQRIEGGTGPADPPLSDVGHAQSEHLASYLAGEPLDALYVSPMRRARETAAPLALRQGTTATVVEGLAEYDRHHHEYVPVEELKAAGDPRWRQMTEGGYYEAPGQSLHEFQAVVVPTIEALIEAHPGQRIAAVCHGGVINAFLAYVVGRADPGIFFYPNYTSIHRVMAQRGGKRSIVTVNETAHLRGTGLPSGLYG